MILSVSFILPITKSETRHNLEVSVSTNPVFSINMTSLNSFTANTTGGTNTTLRVELRPSRMDKFLLVSGDGSEGVTFTRQDHVGFSVDGKTFTGHEEVFLRVSSDESGNLATVSLTVNMLKKGVDSKRRKFVNRKRGYWRRKLEENKKRRIDDLKSLVRILNLAR